MILRPAKHSQEKDLLEMMQTKLRRVEHRSKLPPYTLIICEGTKTEPYYIQGLADRINWKFSEFIRNNRIVTFGTGRNTRGLLKFAREFIKIQENRIYSRIWLMYDKDDFPNDNFDNTQFSIDSNNDTERNYRAAWSNECIELWFILHLQELTSNVSRAQYRVILQRHFDYEKNLSNLYEILEEIGDVDLAISRAKRLIAENQNNSPSKMAPATRVYELVEELRSYLD